MATIGNLALTFNDLRKRQAPDGAIDHIIEVLKQSNPCMDDIKWMAGNLPTGNQTTQRTALPDVYLRQINRGVPVSKSSTKQVVDTCCLIEAQSQIDTKLLVIQQDPQAFRRSEDDAFIESMSQKVAGMLFYGNSTKNMDEFNGFSVRYNKLSDRKGAAGYQVVSAGGTAEGKLSSAWLVGWGDRAVAGIYPKYGYAGLKYEDLGKQRVLDPNGNGYMALVSSFSWMPGLAVMDPRMVAAVRNIDTTQLAADSATSDDKRRIIEKMIQAKNRMRTLNGVHPVWYVSDAMYTFLETYLVDKNNVFVTRDTLQTGGPILRLSGIEVKKVDALSDTEDAIA